MEPMNATALYTADKCEVWTSSQNGEAALAAASEAAGLPVAKCDVHKMLLGGGFGRRARSEYVSHAVRVAKEMPGTPIKLIKSREDDIANGVYHPITQCKLIGALDADNNLTGLHMRISGQSILAAVAPARLAEGGRDPITFQGLNAGGTEGQIGYTIPNLLIDHAMVNPPIPPWFWRGVNNNQNAIYLECFMDELAHAAGQDPLEFRRKLMAKHPKHLAVLNAVAERVGWGKPAPQGVYRGLAQQMGYGSYVAAAAEISVTGGNKVKIHRIVGATDLRPCRQSGADRPAGRRLLRLRSLRAVLRRVHREGRPHRADQLPRLQRDAHQRDAQGRIDRDAVRRLLGRRRRADDLRRRAGRAQRVLCRDRQAHPLDPAEEPRHLVRVKNRSGGRRTAAAPAPQAKSQATAYAVAAVARGRAGRRGPISNGARRRRRDARAEFDLARPAISILE